MSDAWFHKRAPSEGLGYGVRSLKGALATLVFIVLTMALTAGAVLAPTRLHITPFLALVGSIAGFVVLIGLFLVVVVVKSDARSR